MKDYDQQQMEKDGFSACVGGLCIFGIIIILIVCALCNANEKAASGEQGRTTTEYTANVSAYCPCSKCCGKWAKILPRRTASGHIIKPGEKFIAAPKEIPFGTMIDIPGYGCVPVLDRGGAIKGDKLDLYFDSHTEALKWGRKFIKVRLYINENN